MQLLPRGTQTKGSIKLDGKELLNAPDGDMCALRGNDIGMVFQEPMTSLNPVFTVGDQIGESLKLHAGLDELGLRDKLKHYDHHLSHAANAYYASGFDRVEHRLAAGRQGEGGGREINRDPGAVGDQSQAHLACRAACMCSTWGISR